MLGYFLGGAVIQNLARQEPDRVRRLALVSTFCGFGTVPGSPAEIVSTSLPIRHYWPWFYERSYLWTVGGRKPPPEKMREQIARCSETPPPVLGYLWQWIAACSWSSFRWLEEIPHSTLVITGSDDPLIPPRTPSSSLQESRERDCSSRRVTVTCCCSMTRRQRLPRCQTSFAPPH